MCSESKSCRLKPFEVYNLMDELHGQFTATGELARSSQQPEPDSPVFRGTVNVDDSPVDNPPVDHPTVDLEDPIAYFHSLNMSGAVDGGFTPYADLLGGRQATPDTPITPTATPTDDSYTSEYDTSGRSKRSRDEGPRMHRRG